MKVADWKVGDVVLFKLHNIAYYATIEEIQPDSFLLFNGLVCPYRLNLYDNTILWANDSEISIIDYYNGPFPIEVEMYRALHVIANTPTADYLLKNDPKALEQLNTAIRLAGSNRSVEQYQQFHLGPET